MNQGLETFARLLSQEGINIIYSQKANTAMFDIETRCIIMPVNDGLQENANMLLVSHECSHALHTLYTKEDFQKYTEKYKSLFNVVEDAYIESKIKKEYKGLVSIFKEGYKELYQMNFFELDENKLDTLSLTSRLNLNNKLGHLIDIPFTNQQEIEFSLKMNGLQSNDDVISLCEEIYQYIKTKAHEKLDELPQELSFSQNQGQICGFGDLEDNQKSQNDFNQEQNLKETYNSEEQNTSTTSNESNQKQNNNEEKLDANNSNNSNKNFTKEKKQIIDSNKSDKNSNKEQTLDDNLLKELSDDTESKFQQKLSEYIKEYNKEHNKEYKRSDVVEFSTKEYYTNKFNFAKFVKENENLRCFNFTATRKVKARRELIKKLAKTVETSFLQKRTAEQLKTDTHKKTGKINRRKLYQYRLSSDIFLQKTYHQDSTNHGVVILLDYSSSMESCGEMPKYESSIIQAAVLAEFCHNNDIPFEIIAFGCNITFHTKNDKEFNKYGSNLIDVVSLGNSQYYNLDFLAFLSLNPSHRYVLKETLRNNYVIEEYVKMAMWNTPLIEGLMAASHLIKEYKNIGIEKTYLYLLTDGMYSNEVKCYDREDVGVYSSTKTIILDKIPYTVPRYTNQYPFHNFILETFFKRLKDLYNTYITFIYIDEVYNLISYDVATRINYDYFKSFKISDKWLVTDEIFYVYKHGIMFEKINKLPLLSKKQDKLLYKFQNNPYLDQFFFLNSTDDYTTTKKKTVETEITDEFKNLSLYKLFASNFIDKIA